MAEGRAETGDRLAWNRTAALLAQMTNLAIAFSGKRRTIGAEQCNPYEQTDRRESRKRRAIPVESLAELKAAFVKTEGDPPCSQPGRSPSSPSGP